MKTPKIIFVCLSMTLLMSACKKDNDDDASGNTTYPNYSQLNVGNYWIYQEFNLDSSGNATATNIYDSCYIEKDTTINGLIYFKFFSPSSVSSSQFSFLRDSLHYLVDSNGKIQFSSQDFTTIFNSYYIAASPDTVCQVISQMGDKDMSFTVPLGTFKTSNSKTSYLMYPNWASNGNPRILNKKFAENIGVIIETLPFYTSNPNYKEKRLIRYHVN